MKEIELGAEYAERMLRIEAVSRVVFPIALIVLGVGAIVLMLFLMHNENLLEIRAYYRNQIKELKRQLRTAQQKQCEYAVDANETVSACVDMVDDAEKRVKQAEKERDEALKSAENREAQAKSRADQVAAAADSFREKILRELHQHDHPNEKEALA